MLQQRVNKGPVRIDTPTPCSIDARSILDGGSIMGKNRLHAEDRIGNMLLMPHSNKVHPLGLAHSVHAYSSRGPRSSHNR